VGAGRRRKGSRSLPFHARSSCAVQWLREDSDSVLHIEQLQKSYGRVEALKGLDLDVHAGEVVGLLGPNGAGKTTTFKVVVGLLEPSNGRVLIGGHDLARDPVPAKKLFGFIPDRPYLYEKLTAWEFLEFLAGIYRLEDAWRQRAHRMLEALDILEAAGRLIESFSHGMKQRLTYAGAMLHEPSLLVVDEPMVGLDPAGAVLVRRLFRDFADNGGALLLSTHTMEVAEALCDRIAILVGGELRAQGSMEELRAQAGSADAPLEQIFLELAGTRDMDAVIRALRSG
jgi:ABC-2 type transport system ATP-binding protein